MLAPVGNANAVERCLGAGLARIAVEAEVEQRQLDVFVNRQLVDQVEALEHEPDRPLAEL